MPDLNMSDLTSHQLQLGDLFRHAWEIFSKNFQSIALITIIINLPLNLISALLASRAASTTSFAGVSAGALGIMALLSALLGVIIPLGIVFIVQSGLNGQRVDYQAALRSAFERWGAGVITSFLMVILLILLAILLIVPAVIFGVFWAFAIYAVMDEKLSGMAALKQSKGVVQGRWWKVFGNLIAFGVVAGIASWIVNQIFGILPSNVFVTAIASTISSIATSFSLVGGYLLYRNLKAVRPTTAPPA